MAVPTSGNFEMFGTGSNTTIAGAIVEGGGNVDGLDTFTLLRAASNPDLFDETYSGVVTNAINHVSASQQYRNYPQRYYYMFVRECTDGARVTDGVLGDLVVKSLTDITSWSHMLIPRFPGDTAAYFEVYGTATRVEYDTNAGDYPSVNLDTIAGVLQKSDCNSTPTPTPTDTPTPTPTDTNTPTPTPVTYYYQLSHCTDGPSNSIYVYSIGAQITNGDSFSYFSNCYEYYDVDPGQTGTINLAGLSTCVCATPTPTPTNTDTPTPTPTGTNTPTPTPTPVTYYYQLAHCSDGPSNSIYVFSVGTQITNGDSFSYFSNCYEYYDVDPGQTGTINLAGLSTCVCATPTPTPTNTVAAPTDTPTPTPTVDPYNYYYVEGCPGGVYESKDRIVKTTSTYTVSLTPSVATAVSIFGNTWFAKSTTTKALYDTNLNCGCDVGNTCPNADCESIDVSGFFTQVGCTSPDTPTPTPTSTPTPTPVPGVPSETLGDGATNTDACNDFVTGTGTVRYLDDFFPFATVIYRNSDGTGTAAAGYYSDGGVWRYWNGSAFTSNGSCEVYGGQL